MNNNYLNKAYEQAKLSCDPNTKVGCVIVRDDVVLSRGYNAMPGCLKAEDYPLEKRNWENKDEYYLTKYPYMIHSEAMAIASAKTSLEGASIYVTLFPCHECVKLIIQAGITDVYYHDDKYAKTNSVKAAKRMLSNAGVNYQQINQ